MSETVQLSVEKQDVILLELYALAQRHAKDLVRACYRDDVVQSLALRWLQRLRTGDWDVPREAFDQFVADAIRNRRVEDRRRRKRTLRRDAVHLEAVMGAPREWMSQELRLEEDRLGDFANRVRDTLPRKCVRAHRLVRDDGMTYATAAKRLRVSKDKVHEYVKTVHRTFRNALPNAGIEAPVSRRGGRPVRTRKRTTRWGWNPRRRDAYGMLFRDRRLGARRSTTRALGSAPRAERPSTEAKRSEG